MPAVQQQTMAPGAPARDAPPDDAPAKGAPSSAPRPAAPSDARNDRPAVPTREDHSRPPGPAHVVEHHVADSRHPPRSPEPISGVRALDILGAAAEPVEPLAPFGPATPLTRPPREQSTLVVVVLAVLVLVLGLFAVSRLVHFDAAPLITPGAGTVQSPSPGVGGGSASPSRSPSTAASPGSSTAVSIAGAAAIDPQGDNNENGDLAKNAVDGDTSTSWHSERYDSPEFGRIKKGVGLVLDLGDTSTVTAATVNAPGTDGAVQLRANDGGQFDGSKLIATGEFTGSGTIALRPSKPVSARYLILWFTRVPETAGQRRIVVNDVDVR
jgi:eukaryotic-like serine/threonine-protein kinase